MRLTTGGKITSDTMAGPSSALQRGAAQIPSASYCAQATLGVR